MMIVSRDIQIMRWIHSHGFVVTRQVCEFMKVGKSAGALRVKKLADAGYLKRKRIFHGQARVITLTKKGIELIDDDLPEIRNIPLGTYRHDLMLVDLTMHLSSVYKFSGHRNVEIITERRYRHRPLLERLKNIPDALLSFEHKDTLEQTYIAIELELSLKTKKRLERIIRNYFVCYGLEQIYYFVTTPSVGRVLKKMIKRYGFDTYVVDLPRGIQEMYE